MEEEVHQSRFEKNVLRFLLIATLCVLAGIGCIEIYAKYQYHQVTQEVEENKFSPYFIGYTFSDMRSIIPTTKADSIRRDSIETYSNNRLVKPYRLITRYKSHDKVDYGTATEIANIKCKRYMEMLNAKRSLDSIDLYKEIKAAKDADDEENLLKELNKPCK